MSLKDFHATDCIRLKQGEWRLWASDAWNRSKRPSIVFQAQIALLSANVPVQYLHLLHLFLPTKLRVCWLTDVQWRGLASVMTFVSDPSSEQPASESQKPPRLFAVLFSLSREMCDSTLKCSITPPFHTLFGNNPLAASLRHGTQYQSDMRRSICFMRADVSV